jgi:hypothetical protein
MVREALSRRRNAHGVDDLDAGRAGSIEENEESEESGAPPS